ncbi:MAG: ribosome small subunit-dependent GTPase A [Planctomycetaceae bacterium]
MAKKPKKTRVAFRKNRGSRARQQNLTHHVLDNQDLAADLKNDERLSGKGEISRHRTIVSADESSTNEVQAAELNGLSAGRVLRSIGANQCQVEVSVGRVLTCSVRRLIRTMARDGRNATVAGDRVFVRPTSPSEGVIERVEPRSGTVSRGSGRFEHIIVANVDQAVIVASAADPDFKPGLVDRFLVSAAKGGVEPILCVNKADLIDTASLQPLLGVYARMGYAVVVTSTKTGQGIEQLRDLLRGRESVLTGQSGVGKSTLINAIDSRLNLKTAEVSDDSGKGRHTTRVAELLPLAGGGWIVDTPGIRQLEIWDVLPEEVEGYFRDFVPFVANCRFPDCTHTHEDQCGVKSAVASRLISPTRYQGYLRIVIADDQNWRSHAMTH